MTKRKFTAKQVAAQKRFAEMAKAGKFRKRNPRTGIKAKTKGGISQGREFFVNWFDFTILKTRSFKRLGAAASFAAQKAYDMIRANAGLDTRRGVEIMNEVNQWDKEMARLIWEYPNNSHLLKIPYRVKQGESDSFVSFEASLPRIAERRKNPVRPGAKRSPTKRNPVEKYVIRGTKKTKTGYLHYYLAGSRFLSDFMNADRFNVADGEKKMRAIIHQLPHEIDNITLIKAK